MIWGLPDKTYGELYAIEVDQGNSSVCACRLHRDGVIFAGRIRPGQRL
jgi:hypothetical protein